MRFGDAIKWDGEWRAACPVCGPGGCVDGPGHAIGLADVPENNAEALDSFARAAEGRRDAAPRRVLGWFRGDPLDAPAPALATRPDGGVEFLDTPPPLELLCVRAVRSDLATQACRADRLPAAARRALLGALRRAADREVCACGACVRMRVSARS